MAVQIQIIDQAFIHLVESGVAKSTRRAHQRDLAYFESWLRKNEIPVGYPVSVDTIIAFVIEHLDVSGIAPNSCTPKPRKLALSTIRRYLSSISVHHDTVAMDNPCRAPQVKLLLRRAARVYSTRQKHQKAAITQTQLKKMIATCDDSIRGCRDRALLLLGFYSGGRRRSELVALQVSDVFSDGSGNLKIILRRSKTDQTGHGHIVPVLGEAAVALMRWLEVSQITSGSLFRGIDRANRLLDSISGRTINRIVKSRLHAAGFASEAFGAHSLRSGFITEAARQQIPIGDVMALSGHRSLSVALSYYRTAEVMQNPAAKLAANG